MKNNKLSAVIVFLVILFIVFVFGFFVGKQFSPRKSKESVIKESSLEKKNGASLPSSNLNGSPPASKSVSLKNESSVKKPETAAKTKIAYVKKPVYIYKHIAKIAPPKQKAVASPFAGKIYYTVQVAALSKYAEAKKLADKINAMGFLAYIVPVTVFGKSGKATYQQVRVGRFSDIAGAKSVEKTISSKFKVKPYIIKVD